MRPAFNLAVYKSILVIVNPIEECSSVLNTTKAAYLLLHVQNLFSHQLPYDTPATNQMTRYNIYILGFGIISGSTLPANLWLFNLVSLQNSNRQHASFQNVSIRAKRINNLYVG